MRTLTSLAGAAVLSLFTVAVMAQQAPPPVASPVASPAPSPDARRLPVKRVVLYKNGVGFFEHLGRVTGNQQVAIDFTSGQLDDVLKSLTTVDLGKGKVTGISFNSDDPASRKLGALSLPIGEETTMPAFLGALRGARVEVQSGGVVTAGRLLSVEQRSRAEGEKQAELREISVVTDSGELKTFDLNARPSIRFVETELRGDLRRYLDIVASTRQRDLRRMSISTTGVGERQLYVSYISEVPIWKSTYRLVLPAKAGEKPLLQGWAIVDNTIGEDWTNVELSLVAGSPQSFIQQLSQPYYARRPVVPLPSSVQTTPQTHEGIIEEKPSEAAADKTAMRRQMAMAPPPAGGFVGGVVGGMPAAPPPPPSMAESVVDAIYRTDSDVNASAQGRELGDLFEYRLAEPVTIRKNQSALVPIVSATIDAERVSVWNPAAGRRPLSALWITNSTPNALDAGSFAVLEGGTFTGEGLMDALKPGERRLVSYATDLSLQVEARSEGGGPEQVSSVRISRGALLVQREYRDKRIYTARNEDSKARVLVIEHPNRSGAGWKIVGATKPDETAPSAHRFKVTVAAKSTATLTVEEARPDLASYQVASLSDDQVALFVRQRTITPEVEAALRPILAKKREIATVAGELSAREAQRKEIFSDQERLRENLKALKGSSEEKALVVRYTRQLDEQESRLDILKKETADREQQRQKLQGELNAMIEALKVG
jgi:hypothetical protein